MAESQRQVDTVFLSFTSLDREAARTVVSGLRTARIDVWWDEGGIGWGDDWQGKLEEALGRCGAYLILLGSGGVRRWVKPELGVALRRHVDEGLPILPLLLDEVSPESMPPFLSLFQARRLPADLANFDFDALAAELRAAAAPTAPPVIDACPFPGLVPFEEDAAHFFLGRQSDTLALLARLGRGVDGLQHRWLQVEGPSGVGKSSLVRAGLIPAVRAGWLEEGASATAWTVIILRPGGQPLEALAASLERALGTTQVPATVFQRLEALRRTDGEDTDLRYLLKVAFSADTRVLLVIDQFEELFTLSTAPEALARIDALLASAVEDTDGPLFLVTTIRSDFLLRIGELPRLQGLLNAHAGRYDLQPLSLAGYREIVRIPAQRTGLKWSEPSLPERIVEDAIRERAPLPLVANLLHLLWEAADKRGDRILRADDYQTLNGVAGALAKGGDRLLSSLGADGRERARRLLLAMVKPGRESQDTKRPISRPMALQAAGGDTEAERVLNRLSGLRGAGGQASQAPDPRLIVVSEADAERPEDPSYRVDLAHEALLRLDPAGRPYWKTLRDWVEIWRKSLEDRDLLEVLAEQWQAAGRPQLGALASGRQLRDFLKVTVPSPLASDYLSASRARRTLGRVLGGLGVMVLAASLGGLIWLDRQGLTPRHPIAAGLNYLGMWGPQDPEMVLISAAKGYAMRFQMGLESAKQHWMAPVHEVGLRPFHICKHEVTFAEYDRFALATWRKLPADQGWGREDRPVINVSWEEAAAYADWLSDQTGKRYRLPSEAEWEYAARGGTATLYWWGEDIKHDGDVWANCDRCGSKWDNKQTAPVGSFPENPFGLQDTAGNVWEWVDDCWHGNYDGAPVDGSAWGEEGGGDCGRRVARGGSWNNTPGVLRSAYRGKNDASLRYSLIGFRLAHDL